MLNTVYIRTLDTPPINKREVLRYAGAAEAVPELSALVDECISEIDGKLTYKVCYRELAVSQSGGEIDLGFTRVASSALARNLLGCDSIVLFAATVGIEIDRLIARYAAISPTRALIFQALGAERIESLCNAFCEQLKEQKANEGRGTRPRFSPGYGDLDLELQRDIFAVLDPPRKIGLSLNGSLLMSPSKSVTAIIGIFKK